MQPTAVQPSHQPRFNRMGNREATLPSPISKLSQKYKGTNLPALARRAVQILLKSQGEAMRKPKDRKEIAFRQLCMVVKTVLMRNPAIDDAEWKAKTREVLAKMEFAEPDTERLSRAMTQVEEALKQTIGPRPVRSTQTALSAPTASATPPISEAEKRSHRPAGWSIVLDLMRRPQIARDSSPSLQAPSGPREILKVDEGEALAEFWRVAGREDGNRLSLLKAFAELAIFRPSEWNYRRAEWRPRCHHDCRLSADFCFSCRNADRPRDWHHVIQLQHGGSDTVRNKVSICIECHDAIHPWLKSDRRQDGFESLADIAPRSVAVSARETA